MMVAIKKLKAEEKVMEDLVAEDEALEEALMYPPPPMHDMLTSEATVNPSTKQVQRRRMRKRKQQN